MNEYERIEQLEKRIEFIEKILKMMMDEDSWNHHLNGTPIRDSAHDIGNPNCGTMN